VWASLFVRVQRRDPPIRVERWIEASKDEHGECRAPTSPDHIAIQRATTAAFFTSGVMRREALEGLFSVAMVADVFRVFAEASRGRGMMDGLDADVFGAAPEMVAVSFDARRQLDRRRSALVAHHPAFGVTGEILKDSPSGVAQML
jgi:hypothetical protein